MELEEKGPEWKAALSGRTNLEGSMMGRHQPERKLQCQGESLGTERQPGREHGKKDKPCNEPSAGRNTPGTWEGRANPGNKLAGERPTWKGACGVPTRDGAWEKIAVLEGEGKTKLGPMLGKNSLEAS